MFLDYIFRNKIPLILGGGVAKMATVLRYVMSHDIYLHCARMIKIESSTVSGHPELQRDDDEYVDDNDIRVRPVYLWRRSLH